MSRVLWFHPRQLIPPRGGGDHRTLGLVRGVMEAGHEVLLVQPYDGLAGVAPTDLRTVDLERRRGVDNLRAKVLSRNPLRSPRITRRSLSAARSTIAAFAPDVSVVSEVMTWPVAGPLLPEGKPWIYDSQNVEHELFRSHLANAASILDRVTFLVDWRRVRRAERILVRSSDAVLVVSEPDSVALQGLGPAAPPVLVPSSMAPPEKPCDPAAVGPTALFVGTLDFPPNIEAIDVLVDEVMPEVRDSCPSARLLVVGRRPSQHLRHRLAAIAWVELREDVPEIAHAYADARCVVMPFSSGSGTKLKLYEALAFGMPIVATPRGVAGVDVRSGTDVLVRRSWPEFAQAVVDMLTDADSARRLGVEARRAFDARLAWEVASYGALRSVITRLAVSGTSTAPRAG